MSKRAVSLAVARAILKNESIAANQSIGTNQSIGICLDALVGTCIATFKLNLDPSTC